MTVCVRIKIPIHFLTCRYTGTPWFAMSNWLLSSFPVGLQGRLHTFFGKPINEQKLPHKYSGVDYYFYCQATRPE